MLRALMILCARTLDYYPWHMGHSSLPFPGFPAGDRNPLVGFGKPHAILATEQHGKPISGTAFPAIPTNR
jgi:hypothetical protein